jgi:hypothetical protein
MRSYTFAILATIVFSVTILIGSAVAIENYDALKVAVPPTIDGNLGDWSGVPGVFLTGSTSVTGTLDGEDLYKDWETLGVETWESDADISATWYVTWDANNLYFACEVRDEFHENTQTGVNIWNGDNVQFAIDPVNAKGGYADHVYEYGYALTTTGLEVWRWATHTATAGENSTFVVVRDDSAGTTIYEAAIPKDDIAPIDLAAGNVIGFSLIANDNDVSGGQGGWVGWGSHAVVYGKEAGKLNDLTLSAQVAAAVSPNCKLSTTWGSIKN